MNAQTTKQVLIDARTKREARKTLGEIGLDISSGIKLFLRNVAITHSVPLELRTANGFTIAEEQELLRDVEYARLHGKRYRSGKELLASIV